MTHETDGRRSADGRDLAWVRGEFAARLAQESRRRFVAAVALSVYFLVAGWLVGWLLVGSVAVVAGAAWAVVYFARSNSRADRRKRIARAATDDVEMLNLFRGDLRKDIDQARSWNSLIWVCGVVLLLTAAVVVIKRVRYSAAPELWDERTKRGDAHQVLTTLLLLSIWIPQWLRARRDLPRLLRECADLGTLRAEL